ncbi:MAG: DsbC family protein [Gammaproteobacteria bacterium]|nr:DsbC family protein [Gammaproteobacteria bacterium]
MKATALFATLTVALLACLPVHATDDAALIQRLSAKLKGVVPDAGITSVKPGPLPGTYEVLLGATVLYLSEDGRYVFRGDIFDLNTRLNITDQRREEARAKAFARLQPSDIIEFSAPAGKQLKTLYVFTDIDCGYCRKFHSHIAALNNAGISVRYLSFPRTGLDSPSYDKAVAVWCAPNRQLALTDAKAGKVIASPKCANPVAADFNLGEAMGVHGTPALFSQEGEELGGYLPAAEIIQRLLTKG